MSSGRDLQAAVEALELRVGALEGVGEDRVASPRDEDPLWILSGIKQRVPDPGAVVFAGAVRTHAGPIEWQVGFPVERLLDEDWAAVAASIASLGNPVRLRLLHAVINGATTTAQLSENEGMGTTGQLYHHLNQLVAQGWLVATSRGNYSIPAERVVPLLVIIAAARRTM